MSPSPTPSFKWDASLAAAEALDAADPLAGFRRRFLIPRRDDRELGYFCGNSLGLQPATVRPAIAAELDAWAELAVDAHFHGAHPWFPYHEFVRESSARLVGARPHEVVMMNGLTVNLHLLMATFYRPTRNRYCIVMDAPAFPSDTYAVQTQLRWHGVDPAAGLRVLQAPPGEDCIASGQLEELLAQEGDRVALVLLGAVNYVTGQAFDLRRAAAAAHRAGALFAADCAHAAGNLALQLHDDDVDFAAWCSYKYLNSGPGSVAGAFIHERHARNTDLPRLGGWWGNDPQSRFRMHLEREFVPVPSADAWQLSNPPILSLAAVRASLELFDEVGIAALRAKSAQMIEYFDFLMADAALTSVRSITPRPLAARGCQHSLRFVDRAREAQARLQENGFVTDFRPPDVIRVAPVPLYNTFAEIWRFVRVLRDVCP